jgi:hypothetical protein
MPLDELHDSWAEALGHLLADERREWQRERELTVAEHRRVVAELDAKIAQMELHTERTIAARLATLQDGVPGLRGEPGESITGPPGKDGRDGVDGLPGAPGAFLEPCPWGEGIHYQAALVTHAGSTWYARRDTASGPPSEDWICVAAAGQPGAEGRSFVIRGTWSERGDYRQLDVVARDGSSFVARIDNPGPCPGDGWLMIAHQGRAGKPGDPGSRGPPGARVATATIDEEGLLTLCHDDGTAVTCDLYPVLARIAR